MSPSRLIVARTGSALASLLLVLSACATPELTVREKAKRVTELRRRAEECLNQARFSDGDPDGVDLEALECYYECHKETVKIFPNASDCPSCYAQAGEAAAMMGGYYHTHAQTLKKHLEERATPEEAPVVAARRAQSEARAEEFFRESMQFFNMHLQNRASIDARVYRRAYEVAMYLEDYKRAIRYLDLWERNTRLTAEGKRVVDQHREAAEREYERSLLREAAGERPAP